MKIVWAEIKKEILLLLRDVGGLALLFFMPALLVVVMAYIQDAAFRVLSNDKVEVIWVDEDNSKISNSIKIELEASGYFVLIDSLNQKEIDSNSAKELLSDGEYQVGIVIPNNFQKLFKSRVKGRVDSLLMDFGLVDSGQNSIVAPQIITISLLFDPLTKATFKTSVANGIVGLVNQMETQISFQAFRSKLAARFPYNPSGNSKMKLAPIIQFKDKFIFKGGEGSIPSSVQHNVPAWSIFAVFFMIVAFSQRVIEERISGVNKRLYTMPINKNLLLIGKPIIGLPTLVVNGNIALLFLFTIPISLASGGAALLIGNWSKTRDQAASFGSIMIIIMAALGGIWVPVFAMPSALQFVSQFSPLYWALEGYYSIIVRGAGLFELLIPSTILFSLFAITFALSTVKRK